MDEDPEALHNMEISLISFFFDQHGIKPQFYALEIVPDA
jgi:hypothetical protein